ncbi:MAG: hypothetical protein O3A85_07460 [Proteobacteria bacterium]|nr:hypothetical protein [Pseudomonadota bacterium]
MLRLIFTLVLCAAFLGPAPKARSAPIHDFNNAVFTAYGHYREALFYLQTGNAQVASFELEEMAVRWRAIVERFAKSPPGVFSADPTWQETLMDIEKRTAAGLETAINNDAEAAKKHLGPIRKILSELRHRNGVINFSDYVDKANAAFDELFEFRRNPPDFNSLEQLNKLRRIVAITTHFYELSQDNAPTAIRNNPEFKRLMETSLYSLNRIWVAIDEKREDLLISTLRGLSSSNRILFLRFG